MGNCPSHTVLKFSSLPKWPERTSHPASTGETTKEGGYEDPKQECTIKSSAQNHLLSFDKTVERKNRACWQQHNSRRFKLYCCRCTNRCSYINYRWHKTIARNIQRAALPSYLLANSFGESTLKPLVSNDVSYSSSVIASAFSSPSPCSSYLVLSEVMTGWSGLTSRVRLPRMYSMARVSPMACSHELVIRMGATICSTTQPIPMQSMALLQAHIQIKDIHPLLHAANRHQTLRSYSLCTFDTFASC